MSRTRKHQSLIFISCFEEEISISTKNEKPEDINESHELLRINFTEFLVIKKRNITAVIGAYQKSGEYRTD